MRHRLIGDQDIDLVRRILEPPQRHQRVALQHDVETPVPEQLGHEVADHRLILDHHHATAQRLIRAGRDRLARRRLGRVGRIRSRQHDPEYRACALHRLDQDVAAVVVHDAMHHRQAHARTEADLLGRHERLEDAIEHVGRDAGAAVGHAELDPRRRVARGAA